MAAENLSYEQVLQLPYHRVFACLWFEHEKSTYQELLTKIYQKTKNYL